MKSGTISLGPARANLGTPSRTARYALRIGDEVLQYLILLRPFVEATMHVQGNAEDSEFAGTRGALWEA